MDEHHVNDLWEDMERLNSLYEELMWDHDDELQFTIEGDKIVISNKSLEE
jgi:negative regulator of genetic competence, sporulation and motility